MFVLVCWLRFSILFCFRCSFLFGGFRVRFRFRYRFRFSLRFRFRFRFILVIYLVIVFAFVVAFVYFLCCFRWLLKVVCVLCFVCFLCAFVLCFPPVLNLFFLILLALRAGPGSGPTRDGRRLTPRAAMADSKAAPPDKATTTTTTTIATTTTTTTTSTGTGTGTSTSTSSRTRTSTKY